MNLQDKKVLVVVEYTFVGLGLSKLLENLEDNEIDFDCIILATARKKSFYYLKVPIFRRHKFFVANYKHSVPLLYNEHQIAGVKKENFNDVLSKKFQNSNQEYINYTRQLIKKLATNIVSQVWYDENKQEK
ncbi:MAG: hypothetical protein ACP5H7_02695 [Minisyncoccia bacterium]